MKINTIAFVFLVGIGFWSSSISAQSNHTISGYVRDAETGEELIGATVYDEQSGQGVPSNVYGFYSLTLQEGTHSIEFSFIGYDKIIKSIDLQQDETISVELGTGAQQLEEAVISTDREESLVNNTDMSVNRMDSQTIKAIPALLGEPDVIRSLTLFPGISAVGEVSSGYNARGGNIDQNLILQDEAPVYNSSHLFGFFSVFNPDAVKNVELIKGGIDPRFGGRLSSVLDVRLKDGNSKKISGTGGVGVIFSRLMLEGPFKKDKASWLVAGRRSYVDLLAKPFLDESLSGSKFNFYDLTAKVNLRMNDNNRFFISGYFGRDQFGFGDALLFDWGNATGTVRWNHIFGNKLFMNLTAVYSDYDYRFEVGDDTDGFNWRSRILNYSLKPEFTYYLNTSNTIRFGLQSIYYDFKPAEADFASGGEANDFGLENKYGLESAFFLQNEQEVSSRLSMKYGVRLSLYQQYGAGTAYDYTVIEPGKRKQLDTTSTYGNREVIASYPYLEPRLALKFQLNEVSSVKASYMRTTQFIHLISNTAASLPIDIWIPSTNNIKPQIADQVAIGYFRSFGNNMYEASVETYYKDMQNQVDYIDNAAIFFNEFIEADLLQGDGKAYGLELLVQKNKGRLTGMLAYTLSRTERQVDGINLSEWFPARFDKPHSLNLSSTYDVTERLDISANFTLASGTPSTFPTNKLEINGWVLPHNYTQKRNNYRIPVFHRLDLSAKLNNKQKEGRNWSSYWQFSIYNVYARRNPFSIFFRPSVDNPAVTEAVRYSIIGSVVPAVSYNFQF